MSNRYIVTLNSTDIETLNLAKRKERPLMRVPIVKLNINKTNDITTAMSYDEK